MGALLPKSGQAPLPSKAVTRASDGSEGALVENIENLTVEALLRKIVERVKIAPDLARSEINEAVCEVDIDCVHYTLLSSETKRDHHLSPREQEIVRLVAEGLPNKCIGAVLEISCWTVATHLRRIFTKLGVNSRAAMIARLSDDRLLASREPRGSDR
jgi:two-component system, NarL family, nitrate/nitrite response regulator NarL